MERSLESPVVVDVGSHTIKAGLSVNFPSDREPSVVIPSTLRDASAPQLPPRRTVRDGVVQDWDCLESLLHSAFYERLGWVSGDEGALLVAEQVMTPRRDREKLTALCFERFGVAGLFIAESPVLSLYSVGKTSGLVADIGHDGVSVAAVVDGACSSGASRRVVSTKEEGEQNGAAAATSPSSSAPLGGLAAERSLRQRLAGKIGSEKAEALPDDAVRLAKHACLRVAESAEDAARAAKDAAFAASLAAGGGGGGGNAASTSTTTTKRVVLPDGTELDVSASDGYAAGEALVSPFFSLGKERQQRSHPTLPELLTLSLSSIPDANARKTASEALMVCGGGSSVQGLAERIVAEGGGSLPPSHPSSPPLLAVPTDYLPSKTLSTSAWAGGAILARIVFQQQQHVSRAEYDECGPTAIHRKAA